MRWRWHRKPEPYVPMPPLLFDLALVTGQVTALEPQRGGRWTVYVGDRKWTRSTESEALTAAWEAVQPRDQWVPPTDDDS